MRLKELKKKIDALFIEGKTDYPVAIRTEENRLLPLKLITVKKGEKLQEGEVIILVKEQACAGLKSEDKCMCGFCGYEFKDEYEYCPKWGSRRF